jgi:hypothetical protein
MIQAQEQMNKYANKKERLTDDLRSIKSFDILVNKPGGR